ncbi:MAG: hypothetical protein IKN63_05760 [Bacilli bacterium]|nr:hypothetical protein [Bacilli bacterium]
MKKYLMLILILLMFVCSGCSNNNSALEFKKDYESINGTTNKNGKEHRTVTISEDNPYEKVQAKDILDRIDKKETFYVYFGDKLCPWCRSVIEKSIEIASKNKITKIYYVPIWNDDGEEILRDKFELVDGELTKTIEGASEYQKLLQVFEPLLSEYNLTDSEGNKIATGEKRIYAPNFIYIEKGVPKRLVTGISEKQTDSRGELTKEILEDETNIFQEFFKNE